MKLFMQKKEMVIITERQLLELTGGGYLDNNDDYMPDGKTSASSAIDNPDGGVDYSEPETGDEHSAAMSHDTLYGGTFGISFPILPHVIRETNSDIANKTYQFNQNIDGKSMAKDSVGKNAVSKGIKGKNLPKYHERFQKAIKKAQMGDSSTLNRMGGMEAAQEVDRIYRTAKNFTKNIRDSKPEGQKIKSAPKTTGNGKAHTKKGVLNYFD